MNGLREIVPPKNVNIVLSTFKKKVVAPKIILMTLVKIYQYILAYLPNLSHTYIKIQNWVYNIYLDL